MKIILQKKAEYTNLDYKYAKANSFFTSKKDHVGFAYRHQ